MLSCLRIISSVLFFFFKQKTAYEMRISDWSSDVCSSDLPNLAGRVDPDTRFNRASLGVYEMGSTFKIFNTAMALEAGTVTMRGGYDATHPIRIARFTINDDHPKARWLSVPEIFKYSSNIGSVKMAMDVCTEGQRAFLA